MADDSPNNLSSDSESFVSPYPSPSKSNLAPFRPSIAVIVGVLTTMFSITFLLLLYAKHCKRSSVGATGYGLGTSSGFQPNAARRNSGIDRVVIESLPVFRFASLRGQKEGLECAVCLCRFEPSEVLRLLPKCKHAFHVECVDTWLDAHSTCPLCRYRVDPEDILLVEEPEPFLKLEGEPEEMKSGKTKPPRTGTPPLQTGFIRFSARHSSAGEKSSGSRPFDPETRDASFRRSVDNGSLRRGAAEAVRIGCLDHGGQKDGPLLTCAAGAAERKRFEHRIIVSHEANPLHQQQQRRWSDLKPSDLLFLRSEMLLTESGRYSLSCARASCSSAMQQQQRREDVRLQVADDADAIGGRNVINTRCVSEITGLSRLRREEEEKAVKRWLAFEPRRTADSLSGPEKRTV